MIAATLAVIAYCLFIGVLSLFLRGARDDEP
jgi:hypothetical protein